MRIAAGSLLSVLLFSPSSHAATVFVPVVNAGARPVPSQMFPSQNVGWVSTLTVSNPVETPLTFRYTAVFGGAFAYIADGCGGSRTVTPNMSWQFDCVSPGVGGIRFVQMDLDSGPSRSSSELLRRTVPDSGISGIRTTPCLRLPFSRLVRCDIDRDRRSARTGGYQPFPRPKRSADSTRESDDLQRRSGGRDGED